MGPIYHSRRMNNKFYAQEAQADTFFHCSWGQELRRAGVDSSPHMSRKNYKRPTYFLHLLKYKDKT